MSEQDFDEIENFEELEDFDDIRSFEAFNTINENINGIEGLEEFERFEDFNDFSEEAIKRDFYDTKSNYAEFIINGNGDILGRNEKNKYLSYDRYYQCNTECDESKNCISDISTEECNRSCEKECHNANEYNYENQYDNKNECHNEKQYDNKNQYYNESQYQNEREEGFKEGYKAALKKCENSNFMFRRGLQIGCNVGYKKGFSDAFRKIINKIACFRRKSFR